MIKRARKFILLGVAVLVVGGVWFFINRGPIKENEEIATIEGTSESAFKDSDGDGLLDWEEVLWQVDPATPDTDGDGTSDGEEVKLNRDPAKPGPDDALSPPQQPVGVLPATEDLGLTENVSQRFFTLYLASRGDEPLDSETQSQLIEAVLGQVGSTQPNVTLYSLSDIAVSRNNGEDAILSYKGQVDAIINSSSDPSVFRDLLVVQQALRDEDSQRLSNFGARGELYKNMSSGLAKVKVPSSLGTAHLDLTNGILLMSDGILKLKSTFDDPVLGLLGLTTYSEGLQKASGGFTIIYNVN